MMKAILVILLVFSSLSVYAAGAKKVDSEIKPNPAPAEKPLHPILQDEKKEADCDKKKDEPIEIKPNPTGLGTGGCSLDEKK